MRNKIYSVIGIMICLLFVPVGLEMIGAGNAWEGLIVTGGLVGLALVFASSVFAENRR